MNKAMERTMRESSDTKEQSVIYYIETPKEIFWSPRKMNVTWKHIEFLYRDKARAKEMPEDKFFAMLKGSTKKPYELDDEA